jgi:outer membrane protein
MQALMAFLLMTFLIVAAPAAHAQSLLELYEAAHDYDASFLAARANVDAAQYRLDQSRAVYLPNVGLALSAGRSLSNLPASDPQINNSTGAVATLNGSQNLYNRPNDVTVTQAQMAIEVSRAELDTAEQDLIVRVSQAYFDVLAAQDNLATTRASLAALSEQVVSSERNFEIGSATITDTREAQARVDLARFSQLQGENDLLVKRVQLDQIVGRINVAPTPLAVPIKVPDLTPSDVNEWLARADAEHPGVRRARLALEIAKLDTEKAKAASLPTVTLNGSYAKGHTNTQGTLAPNIPFGVSAPTTVSALAVTVNVPLFTGFQIQNRVKETLVLEDRTQADLQAAQRSSAQATRTLFYSVGSSAAQVSALEAAQASSQLALQATQTGLKVGVRASIDVLNAQAQLYTTQAQLAKARYDLIMLGLRLRQACGHLTHDDVAAVNALLMR